MVLPARAKVARCDVAVVEALEAAGHGVSRSALQRAFAHGSVRAEGRPLKASARVHGPLRVEVTLVDAPPLRAEAEAIPLSVLYEDEHLLAVDKPAGMVVHAGAGHRHGTLVNAVLYHLGVSAGALPVLAGNDATRPGIVHRLDRDTSGVIVVAKHARAQNELAARFARHDLHRRYLGVVLGSPGFAALRVDTGHARDPADRRRFAPRDDAKRRAITEVAVHERLRGATVVMLTLHTGRTHQIRMHMRHLRHPILADALYGPRRVLDENVAAAATELGRHALHAAELDIAHPITGARLELRAPLPADLERLLGRLRST